MERCEGQKEQTWSKSIRKLSAGARNVEARAKRALNFLVVLYLSLRNDAVLSYAISSSYLIVRIARRDCFESLVFHDY